MYQDLKNKSLGGNIWEFAPCDEKKAEIAAQKCGIPLLLAHILTVRNIAAEDIADFLTPKMQNLMPDPYVMKDMEKATAAIGQAIMQNKQIAIIGDYDVDGATSSAVLMLFLQSLGICPLIHIPERDEGYGPSIKAVDEFKAQGTRLLITVDCGTNAKEVFDYAKKQGMEVVVLDHHEADETLPQIEALVNPKRRDDDSSLPYLKYMAAVGVVFMGIVAVNRYLRDNGFYQNRTAPDLRQWLDLVALGTVCDVVPLLGLNRAFVKQGLKVMACRNNIGLKTLMAKADIKDIPNTYHLGYVLGPRINAGGRVGDSSVGNRLLCTNDEKCAVSLSDKLNEYNALRKEIETDVLAQACEILEGSPQKYPMAFVYGHGWHQGVIGIVAGKLKEKYNVPAFVMSVDEDEVRGSARSVDGLDLGGLIICAKEKGLLTKGGGHTMAAGFSCTEGKIEEFRSFVGDYITANLKDEQLDPVLMIDGCLDAAGANLDLIGNLERLEPYGSANPEPRLVLERAIVTKSSIVGSGHICCFLSSLNGGSLKAMAFNCADNEIGRALLNGRGKSFRLAGKLRRDTWQGRNQAQFIIEDAMETKNDNP
ncbi:MAG: single-stranded-DNA-specific exonuclease RecJ [Alphaproteobacteria bacterium]|nr:single-stranded-DNA-specific exonuclease RecJ [Alphaproteobacteria bacterium]